MPFIMTQQVQPAFIIAAQQSQHAWIMAQHCLSPLVQVMVTPPSVISHLHRPIMRLQQQAIMPFIIMQQLHIPPADMVQRFWSMPAAVLSSVVQVIFMPPGHFSIFTVQRGTIIRFMPPGVIVGAFTVPAPGVVIPAIPIPVRSIIMAFVMETHLIPSKVSDPRRAHPSNPLRTTIMTSTSPISISESRKSRESDSHQDDRDAED
jgi:hypothetical protein